MEITKEEMMEMKKKAGEPEAPSLVEMANQAKDAVEKFNKALGDSKASDEEKSQMMKVYSEFMDLVENKLGQEYDEESEAESEEKVQKAVKMVPMMAGTNGVPESHAYKK
jgi:molecular chaperone DnaK (HSP70)